MRLLTAKSHIFAPLRRLLAVASLVVLAACQTPSSGPQSPAPPTSSPPTSSPPSTPGGGIPGPPSKPGSPTGSKSGKSGKSDGQKSESDAERRDTPPSEGESGDQASDSSAIPPEWEEEESGYESDGYGDGAPGDDVTFEESAGEEDVTFEEPSFEEAGGLSEEELEELEKELDESLGDFDEEMQREQTYAEERANENTAEESLGGVGVFEDYVGDEGDEEVASEDSAEGQAQGSSSNSSDGDSGTAQNTRQGSNPGGDEDGDNQANKIPDDIPSGNDDDIVARQIREAAMKETDPVLRGKLWDEYRKYKNQ